MPCRVGALVLDHTKSILYCPLTEGGVVAAAGAGAGGGGGPVPPHGPPGALPQHHGQGDHRYGGPLERQNQRRLHAPHHGRPHRRHAQLLPQATRRARQEELQGAERRVLRVQVSDRKMLRKELGIVGVSLTPFKKNCN